MDSKQAAREWFDIGEKDFALADHASKNMHPAPFELICYHCQQSAEKYLKGYLVYHGAVPPKIHDLGELEKLCEAVNSGFSIIVAKCNILNQYGVVPRYPGYLQINEAVSLIALQYASDIKRFVAETVAGEEKKAQV
jgi:HEPN domain-containing protein